MKKLLWLLLLVSARAVAPGSPVESDPGVGHLGFALMVQATQRDNKVWRDYATRTLASLPGYHPMRDGERSRFGGNKAGGALNATGFFRVEKIEGRWWLVDPAGYRFINVGVVDVHIPPGSAQVNANLRRRFGTPRRWADEASALLRANGFNGTGAWSDDAVLAEASQRLAYTPIWNFMSEYGRQRGGIHQESGHMGYPRGCIFVFDPEFEKFCDAFAAKNIAPLKDDPWLIGHFSDNELPFYRLTLDNYLKLPAGDAGRVAAEQWVAERRRNHQTGSVLTDADRQAFLGLVVERYLRITTAAIRRADPHHLCLGSRFHSYELDAEPVFAVAGRYLDVIAINYYHAWTPDPERMKHWTDWSGKPFLITEWYAKGADTPFANASGAGWLVRTQRDRGLFYQNFTLGLLESKACVGWHWFKYMDNAPDDATADPSNRDSNKGLVDLEFEPYTPLAEAMGELNSQIYGLAAYFDRP